MLTFDDGFLNPSFADAVCRDTNRLSTRDVRELQDAHNVNLCDGNDETWFDSDDVPQDQNLTILSETEFLETYIL